MRAEKASVKRSAREPHVSIIVRRRILMRSYDGRPRPEFAYLRPTGSFDCRRVHRWLQSNDISLLLTHRERAGETPCAAFALIQTCRPRSTVPTAGAIQTTRPPAAPPLQAFPAPRTNGWRPEQSSAVSPREASRTPDD